MSQKIKQFFLALFLCTHLAIAQTNSVTNTTSYNGIIVTTITTTIVSSNGAVIMPIIASKTANNTTLTVVTNNPTTVTNFVNTTTNLLKTLGVSTNGTKITGDVLTTLIDVQPYLANKRVDVDTAFLYNSSLLKQKYGGFFGISIPTGTQSSLGLGAAYLNKQLYDANLSFKLGTSIYLPIFHNTFWWIAQGADYNLTKGIGSYSFIGVMDDIHIFKNLDFCIGPSMGDITTISGITFAGTAKFAITW